MADFLPAVENTIKWEGSKYTHELNYDGEGTKYGITEKYSFYRAIELGIISRETNIKDLSEQQAVLIYKGLYWNPNILLSKINNQEIANKIFDGCVNMGSRTSIHIMQTTVNIVYKKKFKEDGVLTDELIDFINKTDSKKLLNEYKKRLIIHYEEIVTREQEHKKFLKGWINRANS